jgi:hypothetical protein
MSSNQTTSSRSMNGIISLYSEDIAVNDLDAKEIDVDDLTINNSLLVNNITLSPETISFLDGATSNLQVQIDTINLDLDNYVDLSSNQTILGNKNFSSILELTGDLLVSNSNFIPENTTISKEQLSTLKDINTTKTIQEQINNVSIDGFMDLTTIQVSQAFKVFSNGLQTPSITNQEGTGIVNGYFINTTQVLYTSYSGTFTLNVSKLTGIDSNETITVFDTVNKLITIDTATTTSLPIKNIESYKPNDATTEIFIYYTIPPNLQQNQGVIFNEISDFIDVINTYSYFPLNSISVNSSFIKSFQGYINNGKLITPTTIAYNNFIEGTGTNRPTIIREDNPQLTNIYLIASPNSFTNEPIKSTPSGFIKNGNFWLSTSYTLSDNNFVEGSSTTIQEGTEITNSNVDSYQYTTTVNDSVSYYTGEGIVVGASPQLRIFDTSQITIGSGLYNTTDNDEYGFVSSIQSGYRIFTSKSNLISDSFITLNAYINSNRNLVCLTNNTNKFSSTDGITKIIEQIGTTHTYVIQSPLLINPDTFSSTLGYKYDANTLITDTIINNDFFFEIPSVVNQYGSFVSTFNDFLLPCINSDYVSPTKSGTYKACVVAMGSKDYIFFGAYDVAGTNDFVVNEQLAPYISVCEIELGYTPPRTYNGKEINGLRVAPTTSSSITNNIDYCIHDGQYFFETTLLSINDVVVKNTSNTFINGRYIQSQTGNGYKLSTLTGGYTEGFQVPRAGNKTWSKNKALNIFSAKSQYAGGTNPQIGNFLICNDPNFIVSKITNVISNGTNWEIEIGPNVNFSSFVSGSDLFLYTTYGTITNGFYSPVDFDVYEGLNINRFIQTQSFYENKSYDFYNQETNDIYENRTYDEFLNSNSDIYNNNQYIIDTTVLLDLPNTGINDTIVVENFSQNLSQKTFTDDTTFQQDIDVVDVRASGNIDCVDLTATGNIGCVDLTASGDVGCVDLTATGDVGCVDVNGSGLLDMTDITLEHQLGSVYIGRQYNNASTNYGLSVGSSLTNTNNFIISRNEANNITALNSKDILDLRVNNVQRFRIDTTYSTILNDVVLQKGYIQLFFRNGQSLPNGSIQTVQWTSNTLPTGFTKNNVGGGFSTQLTNTSGRTRTLVMGGNLSINTGNSGFLLIWLGQGSTRLFTFQAPIENGSISVSIAFTYQIANNATVFFQAYQNRGGTSTILDSSTRRSRVFGQIL